MEKERNIIKEVVLEPPCHKLDPKGNVTRMLSKVMKELNEGQLNFEW